MMQETKNNITQQQQPASTTSLTRQTSTSATKIPVNRIKRIMQANKEIGKIQ